MSKNVTPNFFAISQAPDVNVADLSLARKEHREFKTIERIKRQKNLLQTMQSLLVQTAESLPGKGGHDNVVLAC